MITTYAYDRANRLRTATAAGGAVTTYTHDAAGHRTSVVPPGGGASYYTWDAGGRLGVAEPAAAIGPITFSYDADGRRAAKEPDGGAAVGFLYDLDRLLHETDEPLGGDVSRTYAVSATSDEFGDLISETGEMAHVYDARANTDALLDESGAADARYKYDAFGRVSAYSVEGGAWQAASAGGWPDLPPELTTHMLAGGRKQYYLDGETELFLLGAGNRDRGGRYYDAGTGRFLSEDPERDGQRESGGVGGPNLYVYAGNDPVNRLDPSGHRASDGDENEQRRAQAEQQTRPAAAGAGGMAGGRPGVSVRVHSDPAEAFDRPGEGRDGQATAPADNGRPARERVPSDGGPGDPDGKLRGAGEAGPPGSKETSGQRRQRREVAEARQARADLLASRKFLRRFKHELRKADRAERGERRRVRRDARRDFRRDLREERAKQVRKGVHGRELRETMSDFEQDLRQEQAGWRHTAQLFRGQDAWNGAAEKAEQHVFTGPEADRAKRRAEADGRRQEKAAKQQRRLAQQKPSDRPDAARRRFRGEGYEQSVAYDEALDRTTYTRDYDYGPTGTLAVPGRPTLPAGRHGLPKRRPFVPPPATFGSPLPGAVEPAPEMRTPFDAGALRREWETPPATAEDVAADRAAHAREVAEFTQRTLDRIDARLDDMPAEAEAEAVAAASPPGGGLRSPTAPAAGAARRPRHPTPGAAAPGELVVVGRKGGHAELNGRMYPMEERPMTSEDALRALAAEQVAAGRPVSEKAIEAALEAFRGGKRSWRVPSLKEDPEATRRLRYATARTATFASRTEEQLREEGVPGGRAASLARAGELVPSEADQLRLFMNRDPSQIRQEDFTLPGGQSVTRFWTDDGAEAYRMREVTGVGSWGDEFFMGGVDVHIGGAAQFVTGSRLGLREREMYSVHYGETYFRDRGAIVERQAMVEKLGLAALAVGVGLGFRPATPGTKQGTARGSARPGTAPAAGASDARGVQRLPARKADPEVRPPSGENVTRNAGPATTVPKSGSQSAGANTVSVAGPVLEVPPAAPRPPKSPSAKPQPPQPGSLYRGDIRHRPGSAPIGEPLSELTHTERAQMMYDHVKQTRAHSQSRLKSWSGSVKVARDRFAKHHERDVKGDPQRTTKVPREVLRQLEEKGEIRSYTPSQVEAVLKKHGTGRVRKEAAAIRATMEKHEEVLIEGQVPADVQSPLR